MLGHCVAILHEKLGWGLVMVWWVGLPKFIDPAKIGLANGQPGSDTKSVTTGFLGYKFPEKRPVCSPAPGLLLADEVPT